MNQGLSLPGFVMALAIAGFVKILKKETPSVTETIYFHSIILLLL